MPFLQRRLCLSGDKLALLYEVQIAEGDRRDVLAWRHLGDAELWWRSPTRTSRRPAELTDPIGKRLRITLPEGVPGTNG